MCPPYVIFGFPPLTTPVCLSPQHSLRWLLLLIPNLLRWSKSLSYRTTQNYKIISSKLTLIYNSPIPYSSNVFRLYLSSHFIWFSIFPLLIKLNRFLTFTGLCKNPPYSSPSVTLNDTLKVELVVLDLYESYIVKSNVTIKQTRLVPVRNLSSEM